MVFFVLDDPANLANVLDTLVGGGIRGANIVESTGLYSHHRKLIPMRYLYSSQTIDEKDNITIFALVEDKNEADKCLMLIESVVGNLDGPNTGVFAAWPVEVIKGLIDHSPKGD